MSAFKPVIAIDIDEVLNSFVKELSAFINREYGSNWTEEDYHSYHFMDVWGGSNDDAAEKVYKFMNSEHFANLPPNLHARDVMKRHQDSFEFVVVTSRSLNMREWTEVWIKSHFGDVFSEIHFGNHYGTGRKLTKGEICQSINAICLVDDNIHYVREASPMLKHSILFGNYRWNRLTSTEEAELPLNVTRCLDWSHVDRFLEDLKVYV